MPDSLRVALLRLVAGLLVVAAVPAWSGSFSISPVRVELSPQEATAAVTVTNTGDEPASIQLRVFTWRQEGNEDRLDPTRDLIATPPLFTIPPGESQIVRLGLRRPPQSTAEVPFRAIFEEIPGPPRPQSAPGLRINLRISVPVFYSPREELKSALAWRLSRSAPGKMVLTVKNSGDASAQIGELALARAGEAKPFVEQKNFAYVLPGAERSFTLDMPAAEPNNTKLQLRTTLDGQRAEIEVPVE
ncbi:MAG: molecular chaperone [Burkholderiales bacterium]|nr:molecular chaperone [Burkholderiales bacterium]